LARDQKSLATPGLVQTILSKENRFSSHAAVKASKLIFSIIQNLGDKNFFLPARFKRQ